MILNFSDLTEYNDLLYSRVWLDNFCVPWINFADFCLTSHDQLHEKKNDRKKGVKKYYLFSFLDD